MSAPKDPSDGRLPAEFGSRQNFLVARLPTPMRVKSFGGPVRRRGMRPIRDWGGRGFSALMWLGSAFITVTSLAYFDFETSPAFVIERLPLRFETVWLAALRVHVAAAAFGFPLCLLLMTRALQRRAAWHRWIGRVSAGLVSCVLVPSGALLALNAKGGPVVTAGFLLSGAIVLSAMIIGVLAARRRDLILHARAMLHVIGQMSVAVVSRALIVALDVAGVDPTTAYVAALWVPVLASVAVVEWLTSRPIGHRNLFEFVERIRREWSPLSLLVRVRGFFAAVARDGRGAVARKVD
jgi:uncharacterized membrane protein YozB (DUF420 family)